MPVKKPAIFSGLNNKKSFTFYGKRASLSREAAHFNDESDIRLSKSSCITG